MIVLLGAQMLLLLLLLLLPLRADHRETRAHF